MANGLARGPSGYDPAQPGIVAPESRLVGSSGGRSATPGIVKYRPPVYDERQIRAYQQEALAPGVSGLRRSMREVQAGRYKSPTARREALRGAMRGYGEALAPLQVGAGAQARQRYNIQYQQAIAAEQQRVAAEERAAERAYQESLRDEAKEGYEEATRPAYQSRHRAFQYVAPEPYSEVIGLTEASLRPISDEPEYGRSLYPESVSPEPAYPTNWMT